MEYIAEIGIREDTAVMKKIGLEAIVSKIADSLGIEFCSSELLYWGYSLSRLEPSPKSREYAGKKYTVFRTKVTKYVVERGYVDRFDSRFHAKMERDLEELFGKESEIVVWQMWAE